MLSMLEGRLVTLSGGAPAGGGVHYRLLLDSLRRKGTDINIPRLRWSETSPGGVGTGRVHPGTWR